MNKTWINRLASDIEKKHGKEARDRIFGDINTVGNDRQAMTVWFENFIAKLDELNDNEFVKEIMAKRSPCRWNEKLRVDAVKNSYENSTSFEEFAFLCDKNGFVSQKIEFDTNDNVLYLLKLPMNKMNSGKCGKGCHCFLACRTDKYISDLFCHCCTVGFDGRPFRNVFGNDIKIEFIESFITNGKPCKTAVYIPKKEDWK